MAEIEFNCEGSKISIQCNPEEKIEEIINKFIAKTRKRKSELYFLYGGGILNENLTFNTHINEEDKNRNKMSIIVNNKIDDDENEESLKKSKYIICPKCKESARILVDKYQIEIYECKNGHREKYISINDFEQTQNIDESKIKCEKCQQGNKSTSYNNVFFICLNCNQNLCQICKVTHDKKHNIIDYDERFFICNLHCESYISYCHNCKKDLCTICENEHNEHNIISYGSIFPNIKTIKEETSNFNDKKEAFKKEIKNIIEKLNNLIYTMDNYWGIYEDIINNYENKKRNYFLLQNINDIIKFNKDIIKDIDKIINEKNISMKINNIINIYNQMNLTDREINYKIIKERANELNNIIEELENDIIKKDVKLIEKDNELMISSEKREDNNYKDFDISNMKKIITLEIKTIFPKILVLQDGRIIIQAFLYFFIYNSRNDYCFKLNEKNISNIIQMDDGIVIIITESEIKLLDIKEKNYEIIQSFNFNKENVAKLLLVKLSKQKILVYESHLLNNIDIIWIYIYENKKLILKNEKKLDSAKKIDSIFEICAINEKEIAIDCIEVRLFGFKREVVFLNLEKDKKIENFGFTFGFEYGGFCLINKDLLIYVNNGNIYPINLKNHSKKKEIKLNNIYDKVHSILALNEKQFIVTQENYISQYELEKEYKFKLIYSIKFKSNYISKYPKSRLIFGEEDKKNKYKIYLYT